VATQLISVYRGADETLVFTVRDRTTGVAEDITGWSVRFRVVTDAGVEVFVKTVGAGVALTTPAAGVLTVSLTAANLTVTASTAAAAGYRYTLARTTPNGVLLDGPFRVEANSALPVA
jgi:hypothetical protein